MDFALRQRLPELMDQPGLDERLHRQALAGLRRVNRVSGADRVLWHAMRTLAADANGRELRALDIACGGGDVALSIARHARRAGVSLRVDGCDISQFAVQFAERRAARVGIDAAFFQLDALAGRLPPDYDILTCSLFLHHLDEAAAAELLRKMAASARLVLIDDLRRTRVGYLLAWSGCRLLSRSPIVHHDGPQSVAAAFTEKEVRDLAQQAGMGEVEISRHWPQRFLMTWRR